MFLVPVSRNADITRSFDRLFDETFDRLWSRSASAARAPAIDVVEAENHYTVTLDLPGVAKEDVKVSIDRKRVSIEAAVKATAEAKEGERVVYSERSAGAFARSFALPEEVDQASSAAKLENGVLVLTLTKRRANPASQLSVN